jgi:molybdopterin synthase sulfur carrier subunit
MQVRAYATLRDVLGQPRVSIPVEGSATVGEVLDVLVQAHPLLDGKLWDADRKLTGFVTIVLNGRPIQYLQGLNTPVTDADVLALFPPVGGG